jgi:hypothetical protein
LQPAPAAVAVVRKITVRQAAGAAELACSAVCRLSIEFNIVEPVNRAASKKQAPIRETKQ